MASSSADGLSRKRTDLEGLGEAEFDARLKDEEVGRRGRAPFAWAKSELNDGSFGRFMVDAFGLEKPWNWEVRSSY